jgi:hypothetical protein
MAKSKKLDEAITLLDSIRDRPQSDEATAVLRKLLQGKHSVPAANSAKLIAEAELRHLIPDLQNSFDDWMENAVERDPGCFAKFRIAETLYKLEVPSEAIFLQGIRHRQMEPVWGGKQDTACSLRNVCALGLVKSSYGEVMWELADLLADAEPSVRSGAIRAIAYSGRVEAIPLLRFKVQVGDDELAVMGDCFAGLLQIDPDRLLPLVAKFLPMKSGIERLLEGERNPNLALAEMAALAIGEARPEGGFAILQQFWQALSEPDLKPSALLAIGMLRSDAAVKLLKTVLNEAPTKEAIAALEALRLFEGDRNIWESVEMLVEQRNDNQLLAALCPSDR